MKLRRQLLAVTLLLATAAPGVARADDVTTKQAAQHFERAVGLFNEADYRASLAEFRRAYDIAPNPGVLFNIAQTQYQLQNYAAALTTFERFLAESKPGAKHRDDAEATVVVLRTRVGKVDVGVNVAGAEVSIDDEIVGKSPLSKPVLVSIGRRKITVSAPNKLPVTRFVEVAAGDTVPVPITFVDTDAPVKPPPAVAPPGTGPEQPSRGLSGVATGLWITTGALTAGAVATGILALGASRDLVTLRKTFPTTRAKLDAQSSKLGAFSVAADVLGLAAIAGGSVALAFTLTSRGPAKVEATASLNGVGLQGSF